LLNNLIRLVVLSIVLCLYPIEIKAQKKAWYAPSKIGFLYGYGEQGGNFLNDKDYHYTTNLIKVQFYYPLKSGKIDLELVFEPTIGFATHQLLNEHFVKPTEPNYLALREEFTQKKNLNEYILSTNLIIRKYLYKSHSAYILLGVGPMIINERTERLAKGFSFTEVISVGLTTKVFQDLYFDIRGGYRHLSNADLKLPNSGINTAEINFGFHFKF